MSRGLVEFNVCREDAYKLVNTDASGAFLPQVAGYTHAGPFGYERQV